MESLRGLSSLRSVMSGIFISDLENILSSDRLDISLTEDKQNKNLLLKMWKSLMVPGGIAVKWQPAFGASKRKIMRMGKDKPDCMMLNMGFKIPLTTQGRDLRVAVSNSKKCWLRTEQCSKKSE